MGRHQILKGFYELGRTIGCGGFAKVKLATHLATGEKVAIKIMEKAMLKDDLPRVRLELKALKTLSHQHICKLYQVIETDTHYFIVVEYCSGGELFDHIVENDRLSEMESRLFFRQIVSAVAHLHSFGYVHRDLKPENVLLDHHQNLKLIDFGLCARPEGGVQNPLFTSCGSPTYAAPELVLGQQYLGPEVDVWAMGVLLYALLAGFLPFDDQNIDSLYRKILSGNYEEPPFMSQSSRQLIRQMLQIDPKKRITVKELLTHPWITLGFLEPVKVVEEFGKSEDEDVLSLMAQYHCSTKDDMWRHLKRWRYDYDTATYLLLMARKKRGLPLKLLSGANVLPIRVRSAELITNAVHSLRPPIAINKSDEFTNNITPVKLRLIEAYTPTTPILRVTNVDGNTTSDEDNIFTPKQSDLVSPGAFVEPRKPSSIRKPLKRIRSPNLDGDCSPVPAKKTPGHLTPKTSERKNTPQGSSSARKVLGSIERSIHKVRQVLIPKTQSPKKCDGPSILTSKVSADNKENVDDKNSNNLINGNSFDVKENKKIVLKAECTNVNMSIHVSDDIQNFIYSDCSDVGNADNYLAMDNNEKYNNPSEYSISHVSETVSLDNNDIDDLVADPNFKADFEPDSTSTSIDTSNSDIIDEIQPIIIDNNIQSNPTTTSFVEPISEKIKDLCNVSTTQCTDPEFVITELTKALQKKGIPCERKGFTIRGKMEPNVVPRCGGCSFELDICYLPLLGLRPSSAGYTAMKAKAAVPSKITRSNNGITRTNSGEFSIQKVSNCNRVGIRRKRLKGDSWCYKKVCEQVLALTATELRQESLV